MAEEEGLYAQVLGTSMLLGRLESNGGAGAAARPSRVWLEEKK
jgi:hypothetical protein